MPGDAEFQRLGTGAVIGAKEGLAGDTQLGAVPAAMLALAVVGTSSAGSTHLVAAIGTPWPAAEQLALPIPLLYGPRLPPPAELVNVELHNINSGEQVTFSLPRDGLLDWEYVPEYAATIDRYFRCWRSGHSHPTSPQVLAMLADLAAHYPGHVIEIVSAYRAWPYSRTTSRHRHGRAIDLRVQGVPIAEVRDYLWATHMHEAGIGYYQEEEFVHMDYRPGHEAIAWTQRRRNAPYEYNPGWSVKIRRTVALAGRPQRPRVR